MRKIFDRFCKSKALSKMGVIFFVLAAIFPAIAYAQSSVSGDNWLTSPGVIGTIVLISVVVLIAVVILAIRLSSYFDTLKRKKVAVDKLEFSERLIGLEDDEIAEILKQRKEALNYKLSGDELGSNKDATDSKGRISKITHDPDRPLFDEKKKGSIKIKTPEELKKIVIWFIGASAFWLIFGTTVGEYLGMKFVWPELDSIRWLSFGRLRPVHTNTVFWGWASNAMIGLGYFVVARTSNTKLYSYKWAWWSWALINITVLLGNICLMAGYNNGGGEYREYIWPVFILFAIGLFITFRNYYKTVASRKVSEIYISNWYLFAGLLWTMTIVVIAYIPNLQVGLGETVIQGYYMHQGVGMWFMTFTLGLIYYYLPSSLNKPIYSYSLGVLAFWTQLLFYTMIGTHHFIFSPLPWWLQTVAIVFSVGMVIPVVAGTTNFLMTMRGSWSEIGKSYVLPFFLVGVVFYFVGSTQGSLQAFRFTNFIWHFTDFNVAHSHMTMYGIICFILWACIYAILPKITGKEPSQILVGAHFWLAFVGLFAYMISMMAGGTLKGLSWIAGESFINSVILMQPYYVWRAIGGSMMLLSHFIFGYNFYTMVKKRKEIELPKIADLEAVETVNN